MRDCPYSRVVIDPLLRELSSCFGDGARAATLPSHDLVSELELFYLAGSCIASPRFPALLGPNLSGSISRALFARARGNAPDPDGPPRTLAFSPAPVYARVCSNLRERAAHTLRLARAMDDRLTILHPGPEFRAWIQEHGQEKEWEKVWGKLVDDCGELRLPPSHSDARVGGAGARGISQLHVTAVPRLSLARRPVFPPPGGPHPRPCPYRVHVRVALSVGPRVGLGVGPTRNDADPSLLSWPLPSGSAPEYAVDRILAERSTRGRRYFQVRWYTGEVTWEPESNLGGSAALDAWQLRALGPGSLSMFGSLARLDELLSLPLPDSRRPLLAHLHAAMDADGVVRFRRVYPNTTGGVVGGRATFRDSRGRGDTFTACAAAVRAFVFGELYDEVDISRSHVSHVAGCWLVSGARASASACRSRRTR